jgi:uncharacterized membrane protein YdjX (TVP38/TMEM64 family)
MKLAVIMLIAAAALVPAGLVAQERVGNAAIGAVAGGVVFGPLGAAAGAAVGYTAGRGIARDWGLHRTRPARRIRHAQAH